MGDEPPSKFKRICVFCGSNSGNRSVFSDAALNLGHELVRRRINLVYGGGSVGLMGLISQTVRDGGCHVLGVIPKALVPVEISGESIGEVKIVSDMHERKGVMAQQADAFIALPGGYGTMEEVMEMITWSQLGIHDKPIGLLNVDGYYNSLLELFDNGVQEGFIKPACRHIVISASTANELLAKMELYTPLHREIAPRQSWEIAHLGQEMVPSGPSCTVNQSGPLPKRTALLAMMCQGLIDLVLLKKENPEKQRTEIIGSGEMAVSSIGARKIFR